MLKDLMDGFRIRLLQLEFYPSIAKVSLVLRVCFTFLRLFFILMLCSHSAADMPFLLVYLKDFLDGRVHLRAYNGKLFSYIFMYGCRKSEMIHQYRSHRKD